MKASKGTIFMHFVLMLLLILASVQQVATEGKELQIVYDAVCFLTNICIAYILYLSNGGTNNKITQPTLHSLKGHGS
jgi:hypothetical protein